MYRVTGFFEVKLTRLKIWFIMSSSQIEYISSGHFKSPKFLPLYRLLTRRLMGELIHW